MQQSLYMASFQPEIPNGYQLQNQNHGQQFSGQQAQGGLPRSMLFQQNPAHSALNVIGSQQSNHLSGQHYSTQQPILSFPNLVISGQHTSQPEPLLYPCSQAYCVPTSTISYGTCQQPLGQQPTSIANNCSQNQTASTYNYQGPQPSTLLLQQSLSMASFQPGGNKDPLVTEEEYQRNFAHSSEYCKGGGNWPHSTILLYRYSSNGNTEDDETPGNTWKREHNIPEGKHAEIFMIEKLESIQQLLEPRSDCEGSYQGIHTIEVISSNSPCYDCSDKLCVLKKNLEDKVKHHKCRPETEDDHAERLSNLTIIPTEFSITFSNFYEHYKRENEQGLLKLLKNEIKLYTLTDDKWQYFFDAAGLSPKIQSREEHLVTKRQKRESDDRKLLEYLNIIHDLVQERGIKLANHKIIKKKLL